VHLRSIIDKRGSISPTFQNFLADFSLNNHVAIRNRFICVAINSTSSVGTIAELSERAVNLEDLINCGYKVTFKLFDIKKYNVPQKRERVIFFGVRNDIIFEPSITEINNNIITLKQCIGDLPIEYNTEIQHIGTKHKCKVTGYVGNRQLKWDEPSPTITGRGGGNGGPVIHNHPSLQRRLTVRECARIQTFPDNFMFNGSISSMYKQIGNAVPCNFSVYLASIFQNAP
jgi:DNA (cytosine-5)-methyltransferase 1